MMRDDFLPGDTHRESVDEIIHAALRARSLVSQLLAFSRKQILEYKTLDIKQVVNGVEKLLKHTIREDIKLNIVPSSTILTIRADIGQIEQVILNLAINAQDAMPGGGILTIETSIVKHDKNYTQDHFGTVEGKFVMLAISDSGSGMDEDTRKHIFEPFFSTKGELGTGLGLATVYGIVKQHSGNIFVYSEPGAGSTFKIYLPYYEDKRVEKPSEVEINDDLHGDETILLAEDNKHVRSLINKILPRSGYKVIDTENSNDALSVCDTYEGEIHLLLTDVVMPEINGKDLYALAVKKRPELKVLYMSGYTDNVIAHHGILDDGVQFIQKPFSLNDLAAKIREVLEGNPK